MRVPVGSFTFMPHRIEHYEQQGQERQATGEGNPDDLGGFHGLACRFKPIVGGGHRHDAMHAGTAGPLECLK